MHVVFVCATNRCLSPIAARILGALAAQQGLAISAASAASFGAKDSQAADPLCVEVAAARDIDLSGHRARRIARQDFDKADLLVALDRSDLRLLTMERPRGCRTEIRLFSSFAGTDGPSDIVEPKGDDAERYEAAYETVERGVRDLFADLRTRLAGAKIDA